jgi:hypothetical protein
VVLQHIVQTSCLASSYVLQDGIDCDGFFFFVEKGFAFHSREYPLDNRQLGFTGVRKYKRQRKEGKKKRAGEKIYIFDAMDGVRR